MKNINNTAQGNRSFRRLVRQWFCCLLKCQNADYQEQIMEKLQDIEDSIEIIAREIARQLEKAGQ